MILWLQLAIMEYANNIFDCESTVFPNKEQDPRPELSESDATHLHVSMFLGLELAIKD